MSDPKILLYYAFALVADPEAARLWQRELCESLGLRGRIIISKHGINGTVGGEIDACKQYLKRTREYGPFRGIDVKWSDGTGFVDAKPTMLRGVDRSAPWKQIADFPKLSVKVRDELVAFVSPVLPKKLFRRNAEQLLLKSGRRAAALWEGTKHERHDSHSQLLG